MLLEQVIPDFNHVVVEVYIAIHKSVHPLLKPTNQRRKRNQ